MALKIVQDLQGVEVSSRRGGGRTSPELDEIRSMPEGQHAIIPFNPTNSRKTQSGEEVDFDTWANRQRSSLYKTKPKPTLPFKPTIKAGKQNGVPCLIVSRPEGSSYVTDPNGDLVMQNNRPVTNTEFTAAKEQGQPQ